MCPHWGAGHSRHVQPPCTHCDIHLFYELRTELTNTETILHQQTWLRVTTRFSQVRFSFCVTEMFSVGNILAHSCFLPILGCFQMLVSSDNAVLVRRLGSTMSGVTLPCNETFQVGPASTATVLSLIVKTPKYPVWTQKWFPRSGKGLTSHCLMSFLMPN